MIYAISYGLDGPVKIGFTDKSIEKRLAGLQVGSPIDLVLLGTREGNRALEVAFHNGLFGKRVRGEWFQREAALALWEAVPEKCEEAILLLEDLAEQQRLARLADIERKRQRITLWINIETALGVPFPLEAVPYVDQITPVLADQLVATFLPLSSAGGLQ